jgi:hypothetical protein
LLSLSLLLPLLTGCTSNAGEPGARRGYPPQAGHPGAALTDIAPQAGITFRHVSGGSGRYYLPETMGAGCALLDYDGDEDLDLFLVNSARLPGYAGKAPIYPALYRNEGVGAGGETVRFVDVTREAGLAAERYGLGVAVGDYDGDGRPDLYVTAVGANALYRNRGDGTFVEVARQAGVADSAFSATAAWLDYDRDGHLDLFVGNYCEWSPATNQVCPDSFGRKHLCPPDHYRGVSSRLYRNMGGGRFTDVTRRAGLDNATGKTLGVLTFDFNDDGWLDLMLANDLEPNLLYRNNRDGTFSELGVETGVAYSAAGKARAGMGIDSAAFGGSAPESIVIGNGASESLAFFHRDARSEGDALYYTDAAGPAGLAGPSLPFLTFGVLFTDMDLDGRRDLLVANGHIDPNVDVVGGEAKFAQRLLLFRNEPSTGKSPLFREIGVNAGDALRVPRVHRGLAQGDIDVDGDPDYLVTVCDGPPLLLRNDTISRVNPSPRPPPRSGEGELRRTTPSSPLSVSGRGARGEGSTSPPPHWLIVRPIGVKSNRLGIGTRFVLRAGGVQQIAWVRSGSSYASQSDLRAYFGLGEVTAIDSLEIRWPNGAREVLTNVPIDRHLVVREGHGIVSGP